MDPGYCVKVLCDAERTIKLTITVPCVFNVDSRAASAELPVWLDSDGLIDWKGFLSSTTGLDHLSWPSCKSCGSKDCGCGDNKVECIVQCVITDLVDGDPHVNGQLLNWLDRPKGVNLPAFSVQGLSHTIQLCHPREKQTFRTHLTDGALALLNKAFVQHDELLAEYYFEAGINLSRWAGKSPPQPCHARTSDLPSSKFQDRQGDVQGRGSSQPVVSATTDKLVKKLWFNKISPALDSEKKILWLETFRHDYWKSQHVDRRELCRAEDDRVRNYAEKLIRRPNALDELRNEAAAIKFIEKNLDVPVPAIAFCYTDTRRGAIGTKQVSGTCMARMTDPVAIREVVRHLDDIVATMREVRSETIRSFAGPTCVPAIFSELFPWNQVWRFAKDADEGYPMCHGDLSCNNIIVDEAKGRVKAVVDWKFAGFYPEIIDQPYYRLEAANGMKRLAGTDRDKVIAQSKRAIERIVI